MNVKLHYLQGLEDFEIAADEIIAGIQSHFDGNQALSDTYLQDAAANMKNATARLETMRSDIPQVMIVTPFPDSFN